MFYGEDMTDNNINYTENFGGWLQFFRIINYIFLLFLPAGIIILVIVYFVYKETNIRQPLMLTVKRQRHW